MAPFLIALLVLAIGALCVVLGCKYRSNLLCYVAIAIVIAAGMLVGIE